MKIRVIRIFYKICKVFQVFFVLGVALIFCILLYDLFDNVLNGLFVDVFTNTFTRTERIYYPDADITVTVRNINWSYLKTVIFVLLCNSIPILNRICVK